MSKPWITTNRDRLSKRYKALHEALRREVAQSKLPEPDKAFRKRQQSQTFHATGNL